MILGVIVCLAMLRLGVWQLDRAEQKQVLLNQVKERTQSPAVDLCQLIQQSDGELFSFNRFRKVVAEGRYYPENSIYIDNQVVNSKVGYSLLTPFKLESCDAWVMVDRGWLAAGLSRETLPKFETTATKHRLHGRMNFPTEKPPLWSDDYPVADGQVWQYLPIDDYAQQMKLKVLPLVLELAPDYEHETEQTLVRQWAKIDDQWVAKHQGYAFQWFAMAVAFLVACFVLIIRIFRKPSNPKN